jgi:4'-phosphopantetheinyl transferase
LIKLWWTEVPKSGFDQSRDRTFLSEDEIARADRFLVEAPRRCFITARAMLRQLLGDATGLDPRDIQFSHGQNGKPFLANASDPPVFFNLSHSGSFVVAALCHDRELGVDVEIVRPMKSAQRLAERFFSESEARELEKIEEHDRAFFHLWTCKEAYLKAIGTGLTIPLRSVEISDFRQDPPRILSIAGSQQDAQQWSLLRPEINTKTMCTIAIRGSGRTFSAEEFASHG